MPIINIDELEAQSTRPKLSGVVSIDDLEKHDTQSKQGNSFFDQAGRAYGDAAKDLGELTKSTVQAVTHPVDTLKSVGTLMFDHPIDRLKGAAKKVIDNPGETLKNVKDTIVHKPFTTILNASMVGGGAGVFAKGAGAVKTGDALINAANVPFQAGGAAVKGAVKTAKNIGKAIPEGLKQSSYGIMQSIVGQLPKEFKYGANAGRAGVKEGFKGDHQSILDQTENRISEIGGQGDALAASSNKLINNDAAIKVIDDKIAKLQKKFSRTDSATIKKLQDARKDLLGVVEDANGRVISQNSTSAMTPSETLNFKRDFDEITKFKGTAVDDTVFNETMQNARGKLKDNLNDAVPGMKDWNQRYADLAALRQAAARKVDHMKAGSGMRNIIDNVIRGSVGVTTVGAALTGHGGIIGEILAGWAAKEVLGNPTVKSNVAQMLYKLSNADKAKVFQAAPWVKAQYRNIMSSMGKEQVGAVDRSNLRNPNASGAVSEGFPGLPKPKPLGLPNRSKEASGPVIHGENPTKKLPFYSMDEQGRIKGDGFLLGEKRLNAKEANDELIMAEKPVDAMGNMEIQSQQDKFYAAQMDAEGAKEILRLTQKWRKDLSGSIKQSEFLKGESQDIAKKQKWIAAKDADSGLNWSKKAQEFFSKNPEAWPAKFNGNPEDALRAVAKDITENRGTDYVKYLRGVIASARKTKLK